MVTHAKLALLAALASLVIPGAGQLFVGAALRAGVWLVGFVAIALASGRYTAAVLALMAAAALDAFVFALVSPPPSVAPRTPPDEPRGARR